MSAALSKEARKECMKDIIRQLHRGLSAADAKARFEREVGEVTSSEVAEIEQALINDGVPPDEIKKFCNVHALIFQSALEKAASGELFPAHPVNLFKLENREIEKRVEAIKELAAKRKDTGAATFKARLGELLEQLRGIEIHYERKEQILFPYLERQGFTGPSKVMWGKDNEVRELLKRCLTELPDVGGVRDVDAYVEKALDPLLEEASGMVFKEENILFATSLEKLTSADWVDILRESDDVGYVFIKKPAETEAMMESLRAALLEEAVFHDGAVTMPTGAIRLDELMPLLNTLPVDITFVDEEDRVKYFSGGKRRIFTRTKSIIGRKVQNCHPPQSVDVVEKILASFRDGTANDYSFWIDFRGRSIYIRYFAVRDAKGRYQGTMEVTQDITEIKKLTGEKRLLDERARLEEKRA